GGGGSRSCSRGGNQTHVLHFLFEHFHSPLEGIDVGGEECSEGRLGGGGSGLLPHGIDEVEETRGTGQRGLGTAGLDLLCVAHGLVVLLHHVIHVGEGTEEGLDDRMGVDVGKRRRRGTRGTRRGQGEDEGRKEEEEMEEGWHEGQKDKE
ncbi:hypothetical protein PENTCL1PPCAC_10693, partial [Pristionchus entomophagus]